MELLYEPVFAFLVSGDQDGGGDDAESCLREEDDRSQERRGRGLGEQDVLLQQRGVRQLLVQPTALTQQTSVICEEIYVIEDLIPFLETCPG